MARLSIGEFIATLRKANGLTQKQLAEKLNVSDKAVSRWERDESAPDISTIPVIAEVFDVTCDEILRGERMVKHDTEKNEKQIEHLLQKTNSKFLIQNLIVIGIGVLGLLSAFFLEYHNKYSDLSLYLGICLFFIAFICEIIFIIYAFSSFNTKDLQYDIVEETKKSIFRKSKLAFVILLLLFSLILPLSNSIIVRAINEFYYGNYNDFTYEILHILSWLNYHRIRWFGITLIVCNIIISLFNHIVMKANIISFTDDETLYLKKCVKLTIRNVICIILILGFTSIAQRTFYQTISDLQFIKGTEFTDVQEFETYMDEVTYNYTCIPQYLQQDEFYKEIHANLIKGKIVAEDGSLISDFNYNNQKVFGLKIDENNEQLIITAYSTDDLDDMQLRINKIHKIWSSSYLIELIVIEIIFLIMYVNIRKKRNI